MSFRNSNSCLIGTSPRLRVKDCLFETAFHVPSGHPETMKRPVGWVQRSATHQFFSKQLMSHWDFFASSRLRVKDCLFGTADLTIPSLSRATLGSHLAIWGGICGDQEHVTDVFNDWVQTPACACHARRWWRDPQPGHGEMAALFIIAAATVPPFGIPALFRSVSQPVIRLICGCSG